MPKQDVRQSNRNLPPTILTIFGSTGDLSADYLIPNLLHMWQEKLLPKDFHLVCVGRRQMDTKKYLDFIIKKSQVIKKLSPKEKAGFLKILTYYQGDFDDPGSFKPLANLLADRDLSSPRLRQAGKPEHICYNRLYYFATSPQLFAQIARILKDSGLLMSCSSHERKVRILAEKPFGFNLKSAQNLNKLLLKYFSEEQIYRIDHYQGKETVQNVMAVRFANSIFEPLWNNRYIDHIEVSVLEKDRVGERAAYYNDIGALKDMVQNHLLQMLALVTMDEPKEITADYVRDQKVKILQALVPFQQFPQTTPLKKSGNTPAVSADSASPLQRKNESELLPWLVRGQYESYRKEAKSVDSQTETYIALKTFINTQRWQGVPIYLRTGKALKDKVAEVSVHFKQLDRCMFKNCMPNTVTFRIQPDESVRIRLNNKIPGFTNDLAQADLEFTYNATFQQEIPPAYERLLLDFMEGDQRLFIRSDEIEAAWKFIDSVVAALQHEPLRSYKNGSVGPQQAIEAIGRDGKKWWTE